jgi:serine/threonine protein kinase
MWKTVSRKTGGSTCRITYADGIVKKNVCFASDEGAFDTWNVISAIRELSTLEILKDRPHENCVNSFCVEYLNESQSCIFTFIKQQMDLSQFVTCTQSSIPYAYATFNIALQTGRAICHLHSLCLIHCDIKTENVLVSCDDRLGRVNATLCDYGLCRTNNSILPKGQDVVTFSYRAPEHMANASLVQSSVDCWSFGVLILAMLLRKPHPFGTRQHSNVISNVCKFLGDNDAKR